MTGMFVTVNCQVISEKSGMIRSTGNLNVKGPRRASVTEEIVMPRKLRSVEHTLERYMELRFYNIY